MRFNKILISVIVILASLVQGCDKPFEFSRPLAVSSRLVNLSASAGSTHVMVYSDGPWTASLTEPVKWASLNKLSGEGVNDLTFTYSANYAVTRQVGIVLTSGHCQDTVMMVQKGLVSEPSFLFENSSLTLLRSSESIRTPFKTNIQYGLDNISTSVKYEEEMVGEGDETPSDFEKWVSDIVIGKDAVTFKVAENATGGPRTAYISFEIAEPSQGEGSTPATTTLVVTQIDASPELNFSTQEMTIGGQPEEYLLETLTNNIWAYADKVTYNSDAQDWVLNTVLTKDGLKFAVLENAGDSERTANITLSFTDASGNSIEQPVKIRQQAYPREISFEDLRAQISGSEGSMTLSDNKYLEGYIVSDFNSKNIISSPQVGQFAFDRTVNDRTAYIQTRDGRLGMKLTFETAEDAAIARFSRVRILVKNLELSKVSDPVMYTLSGVSTEHIIETQEGSYASLLPKHKKISELTDDDIFTYTVLDDMEILCKDGSYTNATDGYSFKDDANPFSGTSTAPRWDVAPLLLTDNAGSQIYMLTNTACTWRRGEKDVDFNNLLPQGSGILRAVIVHEQEPTVRYGDLGRYQVRYMSPADIEFNSPAFSKSIVEWNWNEKDNHGSLKPSIGEGEILAYQATTGGTADFNNTYNGRSTDKGNGYATSNQKGIVTNGGFRLENKWWDFETNTGRYFDIKFSTAGISGENLIFGMAWNHGKMSNSTLDAPAHWKLLYSVDGGNSFSDVPDGEIKNRSITWWSTTSQDSCPGFKDHLRKLPSECFGKSEVIVRVQVADKVTDIDPKASNVSDESYRNFLGIEKGTLTDKVTEIRIGTIIVRYN